MFISVPKEDLSNDTVCIYKITNLVSKKVYIGQTRNLKSRISDYQNPWTKPHKSGINKALIDEGLVNFKFEIEEKCPEEKPTERENYYIKLYEVQFIVCIKLCNLLGTEMIIVRIIMACLYMESVAANT